MKRYFGLLITLSFISHAFAQNPVAKIDSGSISGARYVILFPENWKGKLVMYAHGYEFMGAKPRQSQNPGFAKNMKPFLDRGFAVAASDYQYQGFALPQGVDDTEALRQLFVKTYGKPDTTYMVGHSMGGGVTFAMLENFGSNYNGGLPLCPLSSRPYLQCRKEFDMYATFNGLFPGIVTSLTEIFDLAKPYQAQPQQAMVARATAIKKAILAKDSTLAIAFAKRFDLKLDDLPFSLFFNENVLRDLAQKAKGNPFDNTNTLYSGFPNNLDVNQKAERLKATVNPNVLFAKYDRTGNINKPVVVMHTIYDQLIPPTYGVVNIENMVHQQGKDQYFTVKYTNGQGHCNFTPQQTAQAFDALRNWVKTGAKPTAGFLN
ncbi:alpha/beta hydrolase [Spirosoma sp. KCTC 42546]|uniref:alpha/beta hydrolase family protein n=1 Tax=Spirosoma sp. KCTC 42546 TaxID=2520506 RepID=UPI0011574A3C|nr:alpha/beta hydrolase [Spirosoma sp. KCTC 42546]QDK77200.1 alpha/beta hydrolase [Spirosoma sp. KCTC 42546]